MDCFVASLLAMTVLDPTLLAMTTLGLNCLGCLKIESGVLSSPRKAGTHTPRPLCVNGWSTALFVTNAGGYRTLLFSGPQLEPLLILHFYVRHSDIPSHNYSNYINLHICFSSSFAD